MHEWQVDRVEEFDEWWDELDESEQIDVAASIKLLRALGPTLPFPHCSGITRSRHAHMRELRIQHRGRPYRVFYAFNPRRAAILLIGGDKTGKKRFYEEFVPKADKIYDSHLKTLEKEGKKHG